MSQFNTIIKKAPWYFLSSVLKGLSGFILLPIYTRYLTPDQYGKFQTLRSLAEFLPLIISLSIHNAFVRIYFDYKDKDEKKLTELYSTIFWFLLVWGILIYFVSVWAAKFFIQDYVHLPLWPFIPLAFIAPVFSQVGLLGDQLLRLNLESKKFSFVSFGSFFISSLFNVVLLMKTDLKIEACLIGYIIINLLPCLFYTYLNFKSKILNFTFNKDVLIDSLKFSLPFQVTAICSWIVGYSDRLFLTYFSVAAVVGNYAIATTISKVLYMFSDSVAQLQGPMSLNDFSQNEEKASQNVRVFLENFIGILTIAFFGISLFSKEMITFFLPKSYSDAIKIIPLLTASYVVSGIYRPYSTILIHFKRNWALSHATILMTVIGVLFNYLFIPVWASSAAAISQLLSTAIFTIYLIWQTNKVCKISINYFQILFPFLLALTASQLLIGKEINLKFFAIKLVLFGGIGFYYLIKLDLISKIKEKLKLL